MDSLMLDVAVGLIFVFGVMAALSSALTEFIASRLELRAKYLLQGLRSLLDGDEGAPAPVAPVAPGAAAAPAAAVAPGAAATAPAAVDVPAGVAPVNADSARVLSNALVANQGQRSVQPLNIAAPTRAELRKLPSYLPGRTFARSVVATLVPNASGETKLTEISAAIGTMPDGILKKSLLSLVANADGEVTRFRDSVEEWYDDHMARVSGWYKRHVGRITIVIGLVLVAALNVNAISIARALYSDEALRGAIAEQAADAAGCDEDKSAAECLEEMRSELQEGDVLGLPIGWSPDPSCEVNECSFTDKYGFTDPTAEGAADVRLFILSILGWILSGLALAPGSRFWFDLLARLGTLRSTGPKPPTTAT